MAVDVTCPKCGGPRAHRSRVQTSTEWLAKELLRFRVHRCRDCGWRGYVRPASYKKKLWNGVRMTLLILVAAVAVSAYINSERVQDYLSWLGFPRPIERLPTELP
jgi:predicted nucleic-acid-binding Zn-ribbon protein